MKGKLSKLLVGLFALVGVFFVYIFEQNTSLYHNGEMHAASFDYPQELGGTYNYLNLVGYDFWPYHKTNDKIYLKMSNYSISSSFVGPFSQGANPAVDNEKFKTEFMKKVNDPSPFVGQTEKAIYQILESKVPELKVLGAGEFEMAMQNVANIGGLMNPLSVDEMCTDDSMQTSGNIRYKNIRFTHDSASNSGFYNTVISGWTLIVPTPANGYCLINYMGRKGSLGFEYQVSYGRELSAYNPVLYIELPLDPVKKVLEVLYEENEGTHITGTPSAAKNTVLGEISTSPQNPFPVPTYTIEKGSDKFALNQNNEVIINIDNIQTNHRFNLYSG